MVPRRALIVVVVVEVVEGEDIACVTADVVGVIASVKGQQSFVRQKNNIFNLKKYPNCAATQPLLVVEEM